MQQSGRAAPADAFGCRGHRLYGAGFVVDQHDADQNGVLPAGRGNLLRRQASLIRPKLIVCLGRISAMKFIKPDFKITREHGQWFEVDGRRVMALYHPAALLRDPGKRPETFDDLKRLQAEIRAVCTHTY